MRGVTLANLRTQLKAEIGDADEANTATDARYAYLLANKQSDLANMYEWSFLNRQWNKTANAGDRYLAMPTVDTRGLVSNPNFDRPMKVDTYYNGFFICTQYGIGPAEYNWRNSDLFEATDPIQRWAIVANTNEPVFEDQIEVWPIPVTEQTLRFVGQRQLLPLVDDDDVCDIDHLLIVYGVAAELLALRNQANAPLVLRKFNERLLKLRGGMQSDEEPIVFGRRRDDCCKKTVMIGVAGNVNSTSAASSYANIFGLSQDVQTGSVLFPAQLSFTPVSGSLTVSKPVGGLDLFATIVAGTLTNTGFDYALMGAPDSDNYLLNYMVTQ